MCYPAHCSGIYSLKPSYGMLSRFGVILYSSSNDVTGPMAHSVSDIYNMFKIMDEGGDINDSNCIDKENINKIRYPERVFETNLEDKDFNWKNIKIGVVDEFDIEELDDRNRKVQKLMIDTFKSLGA